MNVEVKVIKEYQQDGQAVKVGTKCVMEESDAEILVSQGKVKILRVIPSHTPKKHYGNPTKKKY